jgi:hypothetical protein
MKKIHTLAIAIFLTLTTDAQNFLWASQIGGLGVSKGTSVVTDVNGNVYTTGYFSGTADFDPGPGTFTIASFGNRDVFVTKLDPSGKLVWAKKIGDAGNDEANGIAIDALGDIYITGSHQGADFDPGPGSVFLISNGGLDAFVCKLNSLGNLVYAKSWGGTLSDVGLAIAIDASNNVHTTGYYQGANVDFDPGAGTYTLSAANTNAEIFVSKLDATGNFLWAKSMGGTGIDQGTSIALDASGNVYTTGYFAGTADFDPGVGVTSYSTATVSNQDVFISKLDVTGNFVWAKQFTGSSGGRLAYGIALDALGDVYTTGNFNNNTDFDPSAAFFTLMPISPNNTEIFISKLTSAGNFVWAKKIGDTGFDRGYAIDVDAGNNVYITGYFQDSPDFDPGTGTFSLTASGTSTDAFITKLTSAGNFVSAVQFTGPSSQSGYGINIDINNNILTAGTLIGTGDFDPGVGTYTVTAVGSTGGFIAKLCQQAPTAPSSIVGSTFVCQGSINTYSTSANTDATTFAWTLPGGWSGTSATNTLSATIGTASGNVSVTATNACGTSSVQVLNVTVSSCTGINTNIPVTLSGVEVYPNPTNGLLTIITNGERQTVQVYNVLGELVLTSEFRTSNSELNLSNLPNGIYFIHVGASTKKVIKN